VGEANWYYQGDGVKIGPVSQDLLLALIRDGRVNASTLVWAPGFETWVQAGGVSGLFKPPGFTGASESGVAPLPREDARDFAAPAAAVVSNMSSAPQRAASKAIASHSSDDRAPATDFTQQDQGSAATTSSLLGRLVRGELGLARTYWVFAIAVNLVAGTLLMIAAGADPLFGLLGFPLMAYQVLVLIGLWRASETYRGSQVWSALAKVSVIFGWLKLLADLGNVLSPS